MTKPIIAVEKLGKKYLIGANREKYLSLRDEVAKKAHGFYRQFMAKHRHLPVSEDFWAIKDISFTVKKGEAVGIIGRNGAGKSTLLKILSQITPPTEGCITLRGRVASLLEVGTGFHPELTGRENIVLNGTILGMTRREITRKFDEIVAFSEVEQFLDTPVKHYSSGMYVRLAFAVAAHLEPEILVVDEVLAVGDIEFQKKCLGKMGEVAKSGRTVLFVSHNLAAVNALCTQGILLRDGRLIATGHPQEICKQYLSEREMNASIPLDERTDREGDGSVRLTSLVIKTEGVEVGGEVATGNEVTFQMGYKAQKLLQNAVFYLSVWDLYGMQIVHMNTKMAGFSPGRLGEDGYVDCSIPKLPLPPGRYRLNIAVWKDGGYADLIEGAAFLDVVAGQFFPSSDTSSYRRGKCLVDHNWHHHPSI